MCDFKLRTYTINTNEQLLIAQGHHDLKNNQDNLFLDFALTTLKLHCYGISHDT